MKLSNLVFPSFGNFFVNINKYVAVFKRSELKHTDSWYLTWITNYPFFYLSFISGQSDISKEKIWFGPNYKVQFIAYTV
jgi:hypothetical protein